MAVLKEIIVKNCHRCPFANNDNEYGHDACNLAVFYGYDIPLYTEEGLPGDRIHEDCPMKTKEGFLIKVE